MAKAKPRPKPLLSTEMRRRIRREFVPREFAPTVRLLNEWDTKECARGETRSRMVRAVVTLAHGSLEQLREEIRFAREDFRDVLLWSESTTCKEMQQVYCDFAPDTSLPEEKAFLAAIAKVPADNLTRLVYADWLDERSDPRGSYLRVLCEWLTSRRDVDAELFAREEALRIGLSKAWLARVRGMPVRYKK